MRNNRSISRSSSNSEQSMLYNIVSASIETSIWYGECESSISWRAAETWYRHRPVDCRQVHVTASRPSLSGLAGFPAQSHRPHRRHRSVRRSDGRVQTALRAGHPASRAATAGLDRCDSKSNRRVDRPADYRSIPMGWAPHYLTRDRDTSYGTAVTRRLRAMGIRDRPITARSPWQNGHIERLIGSIRRECLDHIVVLGERHLRHLLANYATSMSPAPLPRKADRRRLEGPSDGAISV